MKEDPEETCEELVCTAEGTPEGQDSLVYTVKTVCGLVSRITWVWTGNTERYGEESEKEILKHTLFEEAGMERRHLVANLIAREEAKAEGTQRG